MRHCDHDAETTHSRSGLWVGETRLSGTGRRFLPCKPSSQKAANGGSGVCAHSPKSSKRGITYSVVQGINSMADKRRQNATRLTTAYTLKELPLPTNHLMSGRKLQDIDYSPNDNNNKQSSLYHVVITIISMSASNPLFSLACPPLLRSFRAGMAAATLFGEEYNWKILEQDAREAQMPPNSA